VPQDRHPHQLLPAGLEALNDLFPGYTAAMQAAGAKVDDFGLGVVYEFPGQGPLPARSLGIALLKASRPLIEGILRRHVERESDIAIYDGRRVTEIVPTPDGNAVAAIRCETRDGATETYEADLVIDASSRGELTLALLRATGRAAPEETTIGVDFTYSTALVEFDENHQPPCDTVDNIWVLSAMPDLAYPDTRGARPENLEEASQYNVAIHRAAYLDAEIHERLFNVIALLEPVSEIQSEDVVEKVKRLAAEFDASHDRSGVR
jgi:hypothetical protein